MRGVDARQSSRGQIILVTTIVRTSRAAITFVASLTLLLAMKSVVPAQTSANVVETGANEFGVWGGGR